MGNKPNPSPVARNHGNPFSTRWTSPGAIPYQFGESDGLDRLIKRFAQAGCYGQIIGPHGTGKSTLLATLVANLEGAGREVVRIQLHRGDRRLPISRRESTNWNDRTIVVIDGFEQLGLISRLWIVRACRRRSCGLLVTAHTGAGLPLVWETRVSTERAWSIVASLLGDEASSLWQEDTQRLLAEHGGNLRDTLFALYDLYESRRC